MWGLVRAQNFLKKITGHPSGPGAVSTRMLASTLSSSSPVKDIISPSFSSSETCPCWSQRVLAREKTRVSPSAPIKLR